MKITKTAGGFIEEAFAPIVGPATPAQQPVVRPASDGSGKVIPRDNDIVIEAIYKGAIRLGYRVAILSGGSRDSAVLMLRKRIGAKRVAASATDPAAVGGGGSYSVRIEVDGDNDIIARVMDTGGLDLDVSEKALRDIFIASVRDNKISVHPIDKRTNLETMIAEEGFKQSLNNLPSTTTPSIPAVAPAVPAVPAQATVAPEAPAIPPPGPVS